MTARACFILVGSLLLTGCLRILQSVSAADVEDIRRRGTLRVVTVYGPNSYFIYRGAPMGFEYELLNLLAEDLKVKLEIRIEKNADDVIYALNTGYGDIVAASLPVTRSAASEFLFSDHFMTSSQVLIQKKSDSPLRDLTALIGRTVTVPSGSAFEKRLRNLSDELGGEIITAPPPEPMDQDTLIRKVAEGKIQFTVSDRNSARIHQSYIPSLDIDTEISFPQRIAWALRPGSGSLRDHINGFLRTLRDTGRLAEIHNRYYYLSRTNAAEYKSDSRTRISPYDGLFREAAAGIGWDWRLLASIAYQESRFNPRAKSWAGALGLMQVMPGTGPGFRLHDPADNVKASAQYLRYLINKWTPVISDPEERLKFILASYNAGPGHVEDAMVLARKYGRKPLLWTSHSEIYIRNLANPAYYNDPEVRYGYCRGEEPYYYVREILERYDHYRKSIRL